MSDQAVPGRRMVYVAFTADEYEILAAFAAAPRSYMDQAAPMLHRKLVENAIRQQPTPHPTVAGYDSDDPKAMALDPGFNPDLARDVARGK